MAAQSKLLDGALRCSCHAYEHPWTSSCVNAAAGMILSCVPSALRTYATVYLLALIARLRLPSVQDLRRTVHSILQSMAFLVTTAYGFSLSVCWLRKLLGRFYFGTVAFLPTFLTSIAAIIIERPARRIPLALYVANVGSETLWNMLESRGLVHSIPNGHVILLGLSTSALLFLSRLGLHKTVCKDATFKALHIILGKEEEGPLRTPAVTITQSSRPLNFGTILGYVQLYERVRSAKHPSCPHKHSCSSYALRGGLRPFIGGVGLQVALKLLLNSKKIFKLRMEWRKQIFNRKSLNLGLALGSFSLLYKAISCALRHSFGHDSAAFAIPAGLIGSIGLLQFPNTTVSLYVMWKALQLLYNWGISEGVLPEVPHFTIFLYALFTSILFHAAILEPLSLRPSYYKFLMNVSGNRISRFDVRPFESFGLNSHAQVMETIRKLKIDMTSANPMFPLTT
ncbi:transmembrane protein 135-like [Scaptodrosophila lebanonensis]|uniref:Transmembrane protein 135-like n=1 Tax=Drosophila lebanonensis TaxID=7225 RepID=A0A6J2THY5_DROLE|nr:transmembrane protein 135-like [Scaptodrosophila lebanonensis]